MARTRTQGIRSASILRLSAVLWLLGAGCLEPYDEGEVISASVFGPEDLDAADAPRVDESGSPAEGFTREIRRLMGFAGGDSIGFWRMDGVVADTIVPVFRLERDGEAFGLPIIDALPGDPGYSPFWRVHRVPVTPLYAEEKIWSRAAVEAGVELGLLEVPVRTETIIVAPVTVSGISVPTRDGPRPSSDVWYDNQRVAWFRFPQPMTVEVRSRRIVPSPSYTFQRVSETFMLDEDREGLDFDGDGRLTTVHEVFPATDTSLCSRTLARTSTTMPSIDSGTVPTIRAVDDEALGRVGTPPVLALQDLDDVVLCPREPTR